MECLKIRNNRRKLQYPIKLSRCRIFSLSSNFSNYYKDVALDYLLLHGLLNFDSIKQKLGLMMISFQTANRTLHMKDAEVQDSQARILGLSDEVNRLRKLVETSQVCVCVYGIQLVLVIQVNL